MSRIRDKQKRVLSKWPGVTVFMGRAFHMLVNPGRDGNREGEGIEKDERRKKNKSGVFLERKRINGNPEKKDGGHRTKGT